MPFSECDDIEHQFIESTKYWVDHVFDSICVSLERKEDREKVGRLRNHFSLGKMLRTRLAIALSGGNARDSHSLHKACAATELIHSATLFHDDVIDGASLRRGHPSLWKDIGSTGAILTGDLFFSSSLKLIIENGNLTQVASFVEKVREVCATEMIHELVYRGKQIGVDTCIEIARGKTGPLFAFVAESCSDGDKDKLAAFQEAGYCLGTAYQISDDLLDVVGDEQQIGKTLGTDRKRRKFTLAHDASLSNLLVQEKIDSLCNSALKLLWPWPEYVSRIETFIRTELFPYSNIQLANVS